MGLQAKEYRWPLESEKNKGTNSPLEPPEELQMGTPMLWCQSLDPTEPADPMGLPPSFPKLNRLTVPLALFCLCPSHSMAVHSARGLTAPSGHPCLVSHLITPAHFLHCHPRHCWGLSYVNIPLSSKSPTLSSSPASHWSILIPASWYPLGPCLSETSRCL